MLKILKDLIKVPHKIVNLLYPKQCVQCNTASKRLCFDCAKLLIPHSQSCPVCHIKSPNYGLCLPCSSKAYPLQGIIVNFQYTDIAKKLVSLLKYHHAYSLANALAQKIGLLLLTHPLGKVDSNTLAITSVPSHRIRKHRVKGYNQSELLAKHVAQYLGVEYISTCKRSRHTKSQVSLTRKKRMKNLVDAFTPIDNNMSNMSNIKILIIIDDITTTGSTLFQVASCIQKKHPHILIRGAVFARHGV